MKDAIAPVVFALAALLVIGSMAASCFAPCAWFGCVPAKDIPGRCLMGGGR